MHARCKQKKNARQFHKWAKTHWTRQELEQAERDAERLKVFFED